MVLLVTVMTLAYFNGGKVYLPIRIPLVRSASNMNTVIGRVIKWLLRFVLHTHASVQGLHPAFLIYLQTTSYVFKIAAVKEINWMSSGYKGIHYAFRFINRGNYMSVYRYRMHKYMYFVSVFACLVKFLSWNEYLHSIFVAKYLTLNMIRYKISHYVNHHFIGTSI